MCVGGRLKGGRINGICALADAAAALVHAHTHPSHARSTHSSAQSGAGTAGMAGSAADPTALLRLYLQYAKYEEGARLVLRQLDAWERAGGASGQPVGRQPLAAGSTWFPHALVELLQTRLQGSEEGEGSTAGALGEALARHRQAAAGRSATLRQLVL